MKLTTNKLRLLRMKPIVQNGLSYFSVDDIREKFPDHRCPPDAIKEILVKGKKKEYIQAKDIQELTEFDKQMIKLYNFNKETP